MKGPIVFTPEDFKNEDGDAASPETAAILANDRMAGISKTLAELRNLISDMQCNPANLMLCLRCIALENIDKMTTVVEESNGSL